MKRIGMLTSGGDCQALNAAMRGVVKGLSENVDELESEYINIQISSYFDTSKDVLEENKELSKDNARSKTTLYDATI